MNKIIERYIYDVTRRLPEKERGEVKRELEANINDMLPDDADEQEIADALIKLGEPRILAEQYREKLRYLISPAMFELYISVLKMVVPIVAGVLACIGLLTTAVFSSDSTITEIFTAAVSGAFEGALQAAFWITIGFAIADHKGIKPKPWSVGDLPRLPENDGAKIKSSSAIGAMITSAFFTALIIYIITNSQWVIIRARGAEVIYPFTEATGMRMIPFIIVLGILAVIISALKLYWKRWNVPLCIANIVYNISWVSIVIYILHWNDLFSEEMIELADTITGELDILGYITSNGLITFFSVVFVVAALIDISISVWHTWKGTRELV